MQYGLTPYCTLRCSLAEPVGKLTDDERAAILLHGPWPQPMPPDPSNRVSGKPGAIALGRRLFFDPRLSKDNQRACASCHDPSKAFADGRPRSLGIGGVVVDQSLIWPLRLTPQEQADLVAFLETL